jgi:purine-nucleoside/S-methyl-5'-thioadenosine phosphorylase / adenosine deaminase
MVAAALPHPELGHWQQAGGCVWWEATVGPAALAFTTRLGGVSAAPYDALNLGLHVGDTPEAVRENRRRFWAAAAPGVAAPVVAEQVHGAGVAAVGATHAGRGWERNDTSVAATDALATREAGVPLTVLVADCAPVALVAPEGVLGLAHAGWRGLAGGVLEAALGRVAEMGGGSPAELQAVVGPCIRGCCYEVGEEVWRRFPPECLSPADRPGARRLDLMTAVVHRLQAAGLPGAHIHALGLCTACYANLFFSHRRATQQGQPATGRMALFGWLNG